MVFRGTDQPREHGCLARGELPGTAQGMCECTSAIKFENGPCTICSVQAGDETPFRLVLQDFNIGPVKAWMIWQQLLQQADTPLSVTQHTQGLQLIVIGKGTDHHAMIRKHQAPCPQCRCDHGPHAGLAQLDCGIRPMRLRINMETAVSPLQQIAHQQIHARLVADIFLACLLQAGCRQLRAHGLQKGGLVQQQGQSREPGITLHKRLFVTRKHEYPPQQAGKVHADRGRNRTRTRLYPAGPDAG